MKDYQKQIKEKDNFIEKQQHIINQLTQKIYNDNFAKIEWIEWVDLGGLK